MQNTLGDDVSIIGIPGLAQLGPMEDFVVETGVDGIVHVPDVDGVLWARFGVTQQRTYIYIDDDGSMEVAGYGSLEADVRDLISN